MSAKTRCLPGPCGDSTSETHEEEPRLEAEGSRGHRCVPSAGHTRWPSCVLSSVCNHHRALRAGMFRGGHVAQEGWVNRDAPGYLPRMSLLFLRAVPAAVWHSLETGGTLSLGLVSGTWDPRRGREVWWWHVVSGGGANEN